MKNDITQKRSNIILIFVTGLSILLPLSSAIFCVLNSRLPNPKLPSSNTPTILTTPQKTPSPSTNLVTPSAVPSTPPLPAGYEIITDTYVHFAFALPKGWESVQRTGIDAVAIEYGPPSPDTYPTFRVGADSLLGITQSWEKVISDLRIIASDKQNNITILEDYETTVAGQSAGVLVYTKIGSDQEIFYCILVATLGPDGRGYVLNWNGLLFDKNKVDSLFEEMAPYYNFLPDSFTLPANTPTLAPTPTATPTNPPPPSGYIIKTELTAHIVLAVPSDWVRYSQVISGLYYLEYHHLTAFSLFRLVTDRKPSSYMSPEDMISYLKNRITSEGITSMDIIDEYETTIGGQRAVALEYYWDYTESGYNIQAYSIFAMTMSPDNRRVIFQWSASTDDEAYLRSMYEKMLPFIRFTQ